MRKRTLLSMLAVMVVAIAFTGGMGTAVAQQNPNCCVYFLDVANIPAGCFPIQVWTRWTNGVFGPTVINANGVYVFPTPTPPACPPAATFTGVSLTGAMGPWAFFNNPLQFIVNGCCIVARIAYDANGCTYIYLRRC